MITLGAGTALGAQRPPDREVDAAARTAVVEGIVGALRRYYVVPDVARRVGDVLRRNVAAGRYDRLVSAFTLVETITADMRAASRDAHLYLGYSYEPEVVSDPRPETAAERAIASQLARRENFGFARAERLAGNVGYLKIARFVRPEFAGEVAAATMTFLASSDALIIDVRDARGGAPEMVSFLASYFLDGDPVRLATMYYRPEEQTTQYWTLPYVPGARYIGKDVFVLTSRSTFSAPEALARYLQDHGRATVIGEATPGGTNPGKLVVVHPHFAVFVPMGRPVRPDGSPDRENTGIKPDVETIAASALSTAHLRALERLLEKTADEAERGRLRADIEVARKAAGIH
ncbi:MAG TPA: S41 family peptidase [Gemmatimonadaceae bacterium]|nr:S41 family peptidase [Gemmatimonadaceae bacterium]